MTQIIIIIENIEWNLFNDSKIQNVEKNTDPISVCVVYHHCIWIDKTKWIHYQKQTQITI